MKNRIWLHRDVWTELERTGEYRGCAEPIPSHLVFYGTKRELTELAADPKEWQKFKPVFKKDRNDTG